MILVLFWKFILFLFVITTLVSSAKRTGVETLSKTLGKSLTYKRNNKVIQGKFSYENFVR
jgi:hypothetical protein